MAVMIYAYTVGVEIASAVLIGVGTGIGFMARFME